MRHITTLLLTVAVLSSCQQPSNAATVANADAAVEPSSVAMTQPLNGIMLRGPALAMNGVVASGRGLSFAFDTNNWNAGNNYLVTVSQELTAASSQRARLSLSCGTKVLGEAAVPARQSRTSLQVLVAAGSCGDAKISYGLDGVAPDAIGELVLTILEVSAPL